MWTFLVFTFLFAFLLHLFLKRRGKDGNDYWKERGFPTLTPKIGMWDLLTGKKGTFDADFEHYSEMKQGNHKFAGLMEFGTPVLFVKDLDLARDIYIKDFNHFTDRRDFAKTEELFSDSVFFQQGEKWKSLRTSLSPAFTSGRIRRMFFHILKSAKNMRDYLQKMDPNNTNMSVKLSDVIRRFSVEVIAGAAFGMDINVFGDQDSEFLQMAEQSSSFGTLRKIRVSLISFFPRVARFLKVQNMDSTPQHYFSEVLTIAVKAREENTLPSKPDDFLQLLVDAKKGKLKMDNSEFSKEEKEAQLNDEQSADKLVWTERLAKAQAMGFLLGGFDTIANNLNVCLVSLTTHPEIQKKLFDELKDLDLTYENINSSLQYMDKFVAEVLRLYPAVLRLERKCVKDYQIPGTGLTIPKDTVVVFAAEAIQKDEEHYPDPLTLDPERFSPEVKGQRHSYAYMPFGIGPRNCIGMRFALVETKASLAQIIKNFEIKAGKQDFEGPGIIKPFFGYKAHPDFRVQFIPRK